jgi:hypothetical protein
MQAFVLAIAPHWTSILFFTVYAVHPTFVLKREPPPYFQ